MYMYSKRGYVASWGRGIAGAFNTCMQSYLWQLRLEAPLFLPAKLLMAHYFMP